MILQIAFGLSFLFLFLGGPLTIRWHGKVWGSFVIILWFFSILDLLLTVKGVNFYEYLKLTVNLYPNT